MSGRHDAMVALNLLMWRGLGFLDRLVRRVADPCVLLTAPERDLVGIGGLSAAGAARIAAARRRMDLAGHGRRTASAGFTVTALGDPEYPDLLAALPDPPLALYHRGPLPHADHPAVAIVGTRAASPYGLTMARGIARDLAAAGMTIVSGLAQGIDGAAHRGALEVEDGRTIAVLATGVDVCYPPGHRNLYQDLWRRGTVMSEAPPGTGPARHLFPRRNRIISGLARGLVVVEAPVRSGAMITAKLAGEQGREVFAVPGPATSPASAGVHELLRNGARFVRSAADVLEDMNHLPFEWPALVAQPAPASPSGPPAGSLSPEEDELVRAIGPCGAGVDELLERCGLPPARLHPLLLGLLDRRVLAHRPGNRYEVIAPARS
jgi:DNA processing protein